MPKIEIDEHEYANLMGLRSVAAKIVSNPGSRKLLEQAHKMVDPNAATPALDAEKQQMAPVEAIKKEFEDQLAAMRKEREDEKREQTLATLKARQDAGFARLRSGGYTDEGIEKVQKLMEEKGILDVDDAAAIFERHNPPQAPAVPSGGIGSWNFTDTSGEADKSIQDLLTSKGQNDQIADRMARQALQEFRQTGR